MSRVVLHHGAACELDGPGIVTGRVLLVGEDNPRSIQPEHALYPHDRTAAGWRLADILGLHRETYLRLWRTNLCTPSWAPTQARERARFLGELSQWRVVVMLGRKVATAFARAGAPRLEQWETRGCGDKLYVALPHPSGLSRAWNDPAARHRARAVMHDLAPEWTWGEVDW